MAHDEAVGVPMMVVQNNETCHLIFLASLHYLLWVAAAVDALGVGQEKAHLLQKCLSSAAGVVARCHNNLGVLKRLCALNSCSSARARLGVAWRHSTQVHRSHRWR